MERPLWMKADPVISAFQEQSQRVNVGVQAIMRRAVKESLSMIIEGVHLLPCNWPKELTEGAIVIQVLICTLEEERHRNRFISRAEENPGRSTAKYLENFESIRRIQDALTEKCKDYEIFMVDNVDFDDSVYRIIRYLTDRMGERVRIDYSQYELAREETSK